MVLLNEIILNKEVTTFRDSPLYKNGGLLGLNPLRRFKVSSKIKPHKVKFRDLLIKTKKRFDNYDIITENNKIIVKGYKDIVYKKDFYCFKQISKKRVYKEFCFNLNGEK